MDAYQMSRRQIRAAYDRARGHDAGVRAMAIAAASLRMMASDPSVVLPEFRECGLAEIKRALADVRAEVARAAVPAQGSAPAMEAAR